MPSIDFPHATITVVIFILTLFSFWLRRKTSMERCARANPRRGLTILEKLSLAGIIVWGLHNLNVLALRIWCALEFEYHHFFTYEVFNWAVAKALDYSIMYFKSKELQREPVLCVDYLQLLVEEKNVVGKMCHGNSEKKPKYIEKLSLAVIVFWGLHNVNVLALEAWCSFEKKYHKFFAFEAFTWSVSKALDYSIMFFKSKELQCEPVLQIKKAKILQRYFLFCASMVFILDVASIVSNLNRGGTSFTQDCVLEYSSIAPSQDQLSVIITVIYIFFEPSATISGLYLFIKPFLKYRKLQRTVAAASLGSTSDPKYPSAEHLEEPPNSNVEQKEIEGEPSTRKESQQDFSNLLRTTLFWNCIGVFASQLSVWLVNMQWFLSEDLAAW
eukprot:CAMPEP_0117739094 /NCGR_PEP_ID=MMETSP0947-20121206/3534_1 /TAXON_ID=44440 /ORGANISM="Chattonella subsalsa, Strain CCMP2191" /LENGTH=385 /DNA_ID=CAMNT_0005554937 /DNA_START=47 /DNA_END=1202 /DNA_ORIENTATION=+